MASVDDVVDVSVKNKFPNTLANSMQTILNAINCWAVSCGVNLNDSKMKLLLFTRKLSTPEVMAPLYRKLSWKPN